MAAVRDPHSGTSLRFLVVDDDPKLRDYVSRGLAESGHECRVAADGQEALREVEKGGRFDVILLDVMMPSMDGWAFLRELRARTVDTPVIFVTAREAVEERVKGLRMGADDYVIKPFAFKELLARSEAVVRRRDSLTPLRVLDLEIDLADRRVRRAGQIVDLSPREFDILKLLAENHRRVLSRAEILRAVWAIEFDPGTNVVDVHVARIRRKLDGFGRPLIHTVRGRGYVLAQSEELE